MEQPGVGGGILRDRAQRTAFFNQYRDEVYALALDLTHESTSAVNLVRDVFNEAFRKFSDSPCPADSQPYLYATTFLLFSRGPSDDTKNNVTDPVFAQQAAQPRQAVDPRQLPPYGPNSAGYPAPGAPYSPAGGYAQSASSSGGSAQSGFSQGAQRPYGQTHRPYGQPQRPYGGQAHRSYTNGPYGQTHHQPYEQAQQPPYEQPSPPYGQAQQPFTQTPPVNPGWAYGAPAAAGGPAVPPTENPYAPATGAKPFEPLRSVEQKVEAPSGPFIGKTGKRRRRSTVLLVLNILLFLVLVWVLAGLLIRLELLPEIDLGYEWFNKTLFPLF